MNDTLFEMPEAKAPALRLRADKPVYNLRRIQYGQNLKVNLRDCRTGKVVATIYGGERMAAQIVAAVNEKQETMMGCGDCAKMREALKTVKRYLDGYTVNVPEMRSQVDAALAAPPRNCDVGSAEEQDKRFCHMFCRVGIDGCVKCKLNVLPHRGNTCGIHWAQMPYEEGVRK